MKWTDKGPSWLLYCEIERELNIPILQHKSKPVISLSYAMLSVSAACVDGEMDHSVNTGLHCQFKCGGIQGAALSPIFCADSRSGQRPPVRPLSAPQSISPARDQTICPVTDLWAHRHKARFKARRWGMQGGKERGRETKRKLAKGRGEIAKEQWESCTLMYGEGGEGVGRES